MVWKGFSLASKLKIADDLENLFDFNAVSFKEWRTSKEKRGDVENFSFKNVTSLYMLRWRSLELLTLENTTIACITSLHKYNKLYCPPLLKSMPQCERFRMFFSPNARTISPNCIKLCIFSSIITNGYVEQKFKSLRQPNWLPLF